MTTISRIPMDSKFIKVQTTDHYVIRIPTGSPTYTYKTLLSMVYAYDEKIGEKFNTALIDYVSYINAINLLSKDLMVREHILMCNEWTMQRLFILLCDEEGIKSQEISLTYKTMAMKCSVKELKKIYQCLENLYAIIAEVAKVNPFFI